MLDLAGPRLWFMALVFLTIFVSGIFLSGFENLCRASDEPFTGPANWGGTGLMETPTARILKENRFRAGISQTDPYRIYYLSLGAFERIEVNGRVTEIMGVRASNAEDWSGYGNYKDKAIDLKLQMVREQKFMPAISLGVMDPHGTRVYPSQYIVASKQIYPFDFTLGFGNGRFGKKPLSASNNGFQAEIFTNPNEWRKDSQFFGGIQFAPTKKLIFMAEYSPIKYEKQTADPAQSKYFQEHVRSNWNFGVRWRPFDWSEIGISYQRGEQFGVNFAMTFDLGKPFIPIYDKPYRESQTDKKAPVCERVAVALHGSGFSNIAVYFDSPDRLIIEAQNDKYFYNTRAVGVVLKLLANILSEEANAIDIILHKNGIPTYKFATTLADVRDLQNEKMELWEFYQLSRLDTKASQLSDRTRKYKKLYDFWIKPDVKAFLNDPSGFFKYRAGVAARLEYYPWTGAAVITEMLAYPLNTVSTVNEPLSRPVRSDIVPYYEENIILSRLMFNQIYKTSGEVYSRFGAGILEVEYTGFDGEVAKPLKNGRFILGLAGSITKKREPGKAFELKTDDWKDYYSTAFINGRLNVPEKEFSLDVSAGQFLAGDKGVRFTLSKFINGITIFAWYGITDTSIFKDSYNRGYRDKGVGMTIPINYFTGTDSRTTYGYSIAPWTRDVAQDIDHSYSLFDYIGRDTKIWIDKDKKWLQ